MAYVLIPGTTVSMTQDQGTTWEVIPKVDEVGEFGTEGSFTDTTSLEDTTKEYTGGLTDTPDFPITFKEVVGDLVQPALLDAADARETIGLKIEFPSGASVEFDVALSGYKSSTSEVLKHTVNGKQSGKPTWTRA